MVVFLDVKTDEQITKMDARLAETLVRKWQSVKSLALGPDHALSKLAEVKVQEFFIYLSGTIC